VDGAASLPLSARSQAPLAAPMSSFPTQYEIKRKNRFQRSNQTYVKKCLCATLYSSSCLRSRTRNSFAEFPREVSLTHDVQYLERLLIYIYVVIHGNGEHHGSRVLRVCKFLECTLRALQVKYISKSARTSTLIPPTVNRAHRRLERRRVFLCRGTRHGQVY
jgi:hypothetical protein